MLAVAMERVFRRYLSNGVLQICRQHSGSLSTDQAYAAGGRKSEYSLTMESLTCNSSTVFCGFSFYLDIMFHVLKGENLGETNRAKISMFFLIIHCPCLTSWPSYG